MYCEHSSQNLYPAYPQYWKNDKSMFFYVKPQNHFLKRQWLPVQFGRGALGLIRASRRYAVKCKKCSVFIVFSFIFCIKLHLYKLFQLHLSLAVKYRKIVPATDKIVIFQIINTRIASSVKILKTNVLRREFLFRDFNDLNE